MMEWKISSHTEDYPSSIQYMQERVNSIIKDGLPELIWFLQYPPLYTAGTSASTDELINAQFPVHYTGRGGKFTYHGPGQLVVYLLLDLRARKAADLRRYVNNLEQIIIETMAHYDVNAVRINDKIGVWVKVNRQYKKIGAIGIRVKKWITYHGISININPDLSHYQGIIPCGITGYGVTSLYDLTGINNIKEVIFTAQQKTQKILLNPDE